MELSELLQSLGKTLLLHDLQLNSQGVCQLIFEDRIEIHIEQAPAEEAAHLYAVLGKIPDEAKEPLYSRLLEAQLFFREVGDGCAFALDPEAGDILLNKRLVTTHLTEESFQETLSEFVNWVEHWQEQLSGHEPAGEPQHSAHEDILSSLAYLKA